MNFIEMKRSNQLYFDVKDNELFLTMKEDEIYQTHLIPKLSPHLTTTGTTKEILSTIEILSSLEHFFDQETLNRIKNFFFQHSEYRVRLLFKQTYSNIGKLNI